MRDDWCGERGCRCVHINVSKCERERNKNEEMSMCLGARTAVRKSQGERGELVRCGMLVVFGIVLS